MPNFISEVRIDNILAYIKDASLTAALNDEITARTAADTALSSAIDAMQIWINVKDFGAVGDGVTNDYDAIMDALRNPTHNTYFFPKGRYYIDRRISLPRAGITLIGEDGACIYTDQDVYSMIEITYGNITIYNLEITMNVERGRNDARSSCILIHNTHAGTTQDHVTIEKCHIHHANRYGINMETDAARPFNFITIKNCLLHDLWVCIKNGGGMRYERIDGCRMYNSVAEVLTFDGDERYCTLTNSWLAYNDQGVGLIGADGSSNIIIANNIFVNKDKNTNDLANGITFNRHMDVCYHYTIVNNIFRDCKRAIQCHRPDETYTYMGAESIIVNNNKFVSNVQDIVIHDINGRNEFLDNVSNLSNAENRLVFDDDTMWHIIGISKFSEQLEIPLTANMMRNGATLYNDSAYNKMYISNGEVELSYEITSLADYTNLKQVLELPLSADNRRGFPALISQTGEALTGVVNNQSLGFGGTGNQHLTESSRVIGYIKYRYIHW